MHPMCAGAHSTGVRLLIAAALIGNIHDALNRVASGSTQQAVEEPKAPAVPIKKSVQPDYIVCLDARYVAQEPPGELLCFGCRCPALTHRQSESSRLYVSHTG